MLTTMFIQRIKHFILKNRLMFFNLFMGGVLSAYLYAAYLRSRQDYYLDLLWGVLSTEGLIVILFLTFKLLKSIRIETEAEKKLRLLPEIMISKIPILLANLLIAVTVSGILFLTYLLTHEIHYLDLIEKVIVAEGLILSIYLGLKLLKTWISETNLKEKEERLNFFTELMDEAILIREGTTVVDVNDVLARMLGYEASEMIGQNIYEFMSQQSAADNKEWMKKGYPSDRFELMGKRKDGTTVPILVHGRDIIYKGRPMRLSCGWDITEFKKMQETIEKSEERFKRFAGVTREGILIHENSLIVDVNQALADMLGILPSDFIGKDSLFFVDKKSGDLIKKFRTGELSALPNEITLYHSNGTSIPAETSVTTILWHGREVRAVRIWDISERKKMEKALVESQERFKRFAEVTKEGILVHDKGVIVDVNQALADMLGVTVEEMIGKQNSDFLNKASNDLASIFREEGYPATPYEVTLRRKDGTFIPAEIHGVPFNYGGKELRVVRLWDITERKKMDQALRESQERFKRFAEVTKEGIEIHDHGVIVDANQALADMLGVTVEEMIGKDIRDFSDEKTNEFATPFIKKGVGLPTYPTEITLRRKDGTLFPTEVYGAGFKLNGSDLRVVSLWDITNRKKMEQDLLESQERFKRFSELSKEGIVIHENGVVVDVNRAGADMLKFSSDQIIGKHLQDFLDEESTRRGLQRLREGTFAKAEEQNLLRSDKTLLPVEATSAPLNIKGRNLRITNFWDLTARKKMEEALRQSEESFRNLVEKSPDAIFFHSNNKITYANEAMTHLLKYDSADEIIGQLPLSFLHSEDVADTKNRMNYLKNPGDYNPPTEKRFIRKDGSVVFVEVVSFSVIFKGVLVMVVVSRDLTERKKAEEAVVESQERFKRFSEVSREGILIHENGVIVDANKAAADMTGYSPEEAIGRQVTEFLEEDSAEIAMKYLQEGTFGKAVELKLIRKDKKMIPVEATGVGLNIKGRNLRITNIWDLTSRKEMEEALRKSEHSFRNLIEKSPDAIIIHAQDETVYVNQAMLSLLGYSKAEDLIGKVPTFFVHPEDVVKVKMRINALKTSGDYNPPQEKRFIRKDGTVLFVEVVSFLTYFEGVPMTVAVARDLTERKQAEEALMKFERLSTIGEMAAGMAHEIRNPLAAISTAAQILKRRKIEGNIGPVETILEQSDRLEKLIRDTLDYAKTSVGPILKSFSVKSALESALNLSQIQFGPSHKKIKVSWDLPHEDIHLNADLGRIQQILVNLILNAFQIVAEDGEIKLGLKSDNKFVFIRVEDNGPGISEANMKRIFEPFFTTKDRGSGLGLAISQRIAQEHDGQIKVERLKSIGTAFTLQLPLIGELEK